MNSLGIRRVFPAQAVGERLACFTLDLEEDYAGFTTQFTTITQPDRVGRLLDVLRVHQVPLTVFVVTKLLRSHPRIIALLNETLRPEWGSHSHLHRYNSLSHGDEIRQSYEAFAEFFGFPPEGFRAPIGRLSRRDVERLHAQGFNYDSSIFPALWSVGSGFRHRHLPTMPWEYDNGMLELPFAVVPKIRVIFSISYLKLLGTRVFSQLLNRFPPEPILVIDSHLHDFVPTSSRQQLPLHLRLAYKRNETSGFTALKWLIQELRARGYTFVKMSAVAQTLRGLA